jgi:hypothetical protein
MPRETGGSAQAAGTTISGRGVGVGDGAGGAAMVVDVRSRSGAMPVVTADAAHPAMAHDVMATAATRLRTKVSWNCYTTAG